MDYLTYLIRLRQQHLEEYPDTATYILKKIRQADYAEQNPMSFGQLDEKPTPSPSPYTAWKPDAVYRGGKG